MERLIDKGILVQTYQTPEEETGARATAVEHAVDRLQLRLRAANWWLGLALSALVAFTLAVILLAGLAFQTTAIPVLVVVAAAAGLISPMLRGVIRNTLSML